MAFSSVNFRLRLDGKSIAALIYTLIQVNLLTYASSFRDSLQPISGLCLSVQCTIVHVPDTTDHFIPPIANVIKPMHTWRSWLCIISTLPNKSSYSGMRRSRSLPRCTVFPQHLLSSLRDLQTSTFSSMQATLK